jgi:hypothetical protein
MAGINSFGSQFFQLFPAILEKFRTIRMDGQSRMEGEWSGILSHAPHKGIAIVKQNAYRSDGMSRHSGSCQYSGFPLDKIAVRNPKPDVVFRLMKKITTSLTMISNLSDSNQP